ncbi:tripartite motif-containing protein 45 isoform X2 [Ooceraea biroi]|uniref:Tripartite motif-containing protein n=1 Tax=Ooceraea biroi TaxID=2015173 RepID=A0A026VVG8_OOCBI|nr:tripartite motif-containing protein 45 isoform X2 [Ooceraea biroi]EZA47635.1 Tripartite motif-containing protein [Ooceraea biroi]
MDFVNCSKHSSKSCCGRETEVDSEVGSCDHIYASLVECKSKVTKNTEDFVNTEPKAITFANKRNEDFRKRHTFTNSSSFRRRPSPVLSRKMASEVEPREVAHYSSYKLSRDANFHCPRCGQRMEEPRLLPCLHPICLSCVYELMNKPSYISSKNEIREMCPLCDSHLPNVNSAVPVPHYPLQHRLVMDTMRRKLVNRVLCDTCAGEVLALVQCSTCLRNFCLECGKQHEQQNIMEMRAIKHLMRPLWEATRVRRTILCQIHPMHALRFYCIACQQVTCKECMWSMQHRGHATEDAIDIGKRATAYLTMLLQKARIYVNNLLIQYNHDVFSNNGFEEQQDVSKIHRYVQL